MGCTRHFSPLANLPRPPATPPASREGGEFTELEPSSCCIVSFPIVGKVDREARRMGCTRHFSPLPNLPRPPATPPASQEGGEFTELEPSSCCIVSFPIVGKVD